MKTFLSLIFTWCSCNIRAQYLQNDTIYFDIPNDTIARLWDGNNYNHTDIDLVNKKIINDYYVFQNGVVYALDDSLVYEIGTYHKQELYLEKRYRLSRPLFGKLEITDMESGKTAKIRTKEDYILFEDPKNILTDVLKLWITEKCIRRLLNREEAEGIIGGVLEGAAGAL